MKTLFDMPNQIVFGLTFALFLISCNGHQAAKGDKDSIVGELGDINEQKVANNPKTFTIDPALLKKYQEACRHDTASYDRKFVSIFFELIKKFNGKRRWLPNRWYMIRESMI